MSIPDLSVLLLEKSQILVTSWHLPLEGNVPLKVWIPSLLRPQ